MKQHYSFLAARSIRSFLLIPIPTYKGIHICVATNDHIYLFGEGGGNQRKFSSTFDTELAFI